MRSGDDRAEMSDRYRWGLGCVVGAAAITGTVILVLLAALAFEPPEWVQVVMGLGLVAGGGFLTWLVVSALGQARPREPEPPGPRPVPPPGEDDDRPSLDSPI